ncbi:MAG: hypothetical protein M3279_02610 [Actinomycetota bacterium]|nr:hypothetical protein [Actinomycetota bacterium]
MVVRIRRRDGQRFLGCSQYPKCRHTTGYSPSLRFFVTPLR